MQLPGLDRLQRIGFVGERRAVALLCLAFYAILFFLVTLSARSELPEWVPAFGAMTALYGVTFFAVAAEWFWGRWFATGVGWWGMSMAAMAFVTTRSLPPALLVFGAMHGAVAACLFGEKMAARFEAQPTWRARWKVDDQGVVRLRRSVTRAASSLPALILFALAPREGAGAMLSGIAGAALLSLVVASLALWLASGRTLALLALGAAGALCLARTLSQGPSLAVSGGALDPALLPGIGAGALALHGAFAAAALLATLGPFARPIAAHLRR